MLEYKYSVLLINVLFPQEELFMKNNMTNVALIATPLFVPMAEYIAEHLVSNHISAIVAHIKEEQFADGEVCPEILENVRRKKVYLLSEVEIGRQAENSFKLLVLMDAIRRASGGEISVVLPCMPYARQERRKGGKRVPISAKVLIRHLEIAGAKGFFVIDLHANAIEGFANEAPIEHLNGRVLLAEHVRSLYPEGFENVISLSADTGGVERNKKFAMRLDPTIRIMSGEKRRGETNKVSEWHLMGNWEHVNGKDILIHDDIIDTGGTLLFAASRLFDGGARSVTVVCTHGIFSFKDRSAEEKFAQSKIKVVVSNTVPRTKAYYETHKNWLSVVSIAPMLAEAIRRDIKGESIIEMNDE